MCKVVVKEEIEAMYEMMSLNGDREMNFVGNKAVYGLVLSDLNVDIYKIFVKDEKELNKEKEQLEEAFKFLGGGIVVQYES